MPGFSGSTRRLFIWLISSGFKSSAGAGGFSSGFSSGFSGQYITSANSQSSANGVGYAFKQPWIGSAVSPLWRLLLLGNKGAGGTTAISIASSSANAVGTSLAQSMAASNASGSCSAGGATETTSTGSLSSISNSNFIGNGLDQSIANANATGSTNFIGNSADNSAAATSGQSAASGVWTGNVGLANGQSFASGVGYALSQPWIGSGLSPLWWLFSLGKGEQAVAAANGTSSASASGTFHVYTPSPSAAGKRLFMWLLSSGTSSEADSNASADASSSSSVETTTGVIGSFLASTSSSANASGLTIFSGTATAGPSSSAAAGSTSLVQGTGSAVGSSSAGQVTINVSITLPTQIINTQQSTISIQTSSAGQIVRPLPEYGSLGMTYAILPRIISRHPRYKNKGDYVTVEFAFQNNTYSKTRLKEPRIEVTLGGLMISEGIIPRITLVTCEHMKRKPPKITLESIEI